MNFKLVPAANKNWLVYGLAVFLLLIGVGLTYRQVTGNTAADQRQQAKLAKAAQELANKPAPSGEGFSAKLDTKRKELEQQADQQRKVDEALAKVPNPAVTASLPMPAVSAAKAHSAGVPSDAELNDYAASKEAQALREAKDSSRRLASWEGGAKPLASLVGSAVGASDDLDAPPPSRATTPAQQANKSASPAEMVAAYLRQQQGGASGQSALTDPEGDFLKKAGDRSKSGEPIRAQRGHGRYALLEGSMLEVAMLTGVSSDVGGQCKAQVVRDVFDTVTVTDLLIPAGSTLICTYNSAVQAGQERLLMAFTRLIYPSGATVSLGAMQGGDMQGVMGAPAEVNSRFWKIFGSSLLVAAVATYAQIEQAKVGSGSGNGAVVNVGGVVSSTTASVLADVTSKMLARNTNIKPELKLRAGDRLTVIVSQDMVLDPIVTGVRR